VAPFLAVSPFSAGLQDRRRRKSPRASAEASGNESRETKGIGDVADIRLIYRDSSVKAAKTLGDAPR